MAGDLQFKANSERQIFEKLFMAISFTLGVFVRSAERTSGRRNIFIFAFWCLTWALNCGLMSNKPTHYLLDYGDFYAITKRTFLDLVNPLVQWTIDQQSPNRCVLGVSKKVRGGQFRIFQKNWTFRRPQLDKFCAISWISIRKKIQLKSP